MVVVRGESTKKVNFFSGDVAFEAGDCDFWLAIKFVCIENQQVIVFIIIGGYFVENSIRKKN